MPRAMIVCVPALACGTGKCTTNAPVALLIVVDIAVEDVVSKKTLTVSFAPKPEPVRVIGCVAKPLVGSSVILICEVLVGDDVGVLAGVLLGVLVGVSVGVFVLGLELQLTLMYATSNS